MKKIAVLIMIICLSLILLTGCGEPPARVFDAGQYVLSYAEMDGHALDASALYPTGAYLLLCADGTGRMILGEDACEISWTREEGTISVLIDKLEASGTEKGDVLTLAIGNTGLVYTFTAGEYHPEEASAQIQEILPQTRWSGSWTGRIWFEEVQGKWADFEDRTMAADVNISLDAEGNGSLVLHNSFYSKELPMMTLQLKASEEALTCESGYFMSFPVTNENNSFELTREMASGIETTQIIFPNEYAFGHIYFEEDMEEDYETDVLRIRGRCGDADGYFRYKIVLTR